jgi:Tfp pilus assembly protein PilO
MPFKLSGLRLKRREKIFLIAGGALALLIISYYVFQWYEGVNASVKDRYEAKAMHLKKQLEKIADKDAVRARLDKAKEEFSVLEKGLLSGDKPPVAAAELQKLLKETAMSLSVEIKSERISTPVDEGLYLGIPVEIGFIATTAKLRDIILRIETSPILLSISTLDIRVMNFKNPAEVYAVMTVKGFLRKQKIEKAAPEKVANVT